MPQLLLLLLFHCTFSLHALSLQQHAHQLDPRSLSQNLAFYQLHPQTPEGEKALQTAWQLLFPHSTSLPPPSLPLELAPSLPWMVNLLSGAPLPSQPPLSEAALHLIEKAARPFESRTLSQTILSAQLGEGSREARQYLASLDLMALHVRGRLPPSPSPLQIIQTLNQCLFFEWQFRFPPHSLYAKEIDLYTFLPSVMDSRRGVCLGISILYACLAERLGLSLEILTPPGHIYLRYKEGEHTLNIETTARGVHLDSEEYLSLSTFALHPREEKEMVGMAAFNQASLFWEKRDFEGAYAAYTRALSHLPQDLLTQEFLGYACLLSGRKEEGKEWLQRLKGQQRPGTLFHPSTAEDYLLGHADEEAIFATLMSVDATEASILAKQRALQRSLQAFPLFRSGWFHLAITWLQLNRPKEALPLLEHYRTLEPNDPTAAYYLASLYASRMSYPQAWKHLKAARTLTASHPTPPPCLKRLQKRLMERSPL